VKRERNVGLQRSFNTNVVNSGEKGNLKMFNNTDKTVSAAAALTLLTFLINVKLDSVIVIYLNALIILGLFGYSILRFDSLRILRKSIIIGAIAAATYLPIDSLLGNLKSVGLITYLKHEDILIFGITPLSIFLSWVCLITIVLYFYQRLRSIFRRVYIPILLTGIVVFCGSIILGILGNYAGLWLWDTTGFAPPPFIGSLPLFVPIALFLSFLFSPYFVLNIIAGGIRCGVVLGVMQFLCFLIFRHFATV